MILSQIGATRSTPHSAAILAVLLAVAAVGFGQTGSPERVRPLPPGVALVKPTATAKPIVPEPDASPLWEILDGPTGVPFELPVLMAELGGLAWAIAADRAVSYEPDKNAWGARTIQLPARIGSGAAAAVDRKGGRLFILRGGGTKDVWSVDLAKGEVATLPQTPAPVGIGGALAFDASTLDLYALRGGLTRDFWRYRSSGVAWEKLARLGEDRALAVVGNCSGHLLYSRGSVYAFPDHHVQRWNVEASDWLDQAHISFGFRPSINGGMFAKDEENDVWYVIQGLASRSLATFDPNKAAFAFQRPRLPFRVWGEGSRAVVAMVGGRKHLVVFLPNQGNKVIRIAVERLAPIDRNGGAADLGTPFLTVHEATGSSLVRVPAANPVLGIMGKAGSQWYFGRLHNMRFFDPAKSAWTDYPGIDLFKDFDLGLCAAHDGEKTLYVVTGGNTNFVAVDQETQTSAKPPEMPVPALVGAQGAFWRGAFYVLSGGETRSLHRYDPRARAWSASKPLPAEAEPVGAAGSALLVWKDALLAISGQDVWRQEVGDWRRVATLPWRMSVDGGMAAIDEAAAALYVVEGFGSRRAASVPLSAGAKGIEILLPDIVCVPGRRALVDEVVGRRIFAIHRGADTHEIFLLKLE